VTALWNAADAALATGGRIAPDAAWSAGGVSIDTRAVARDDLFVALKGPRFDGHDFVAAALANGAAAAMVDRPPPSADPARLLAVPDTMAGLEGLARAARARCGARIAAVTGSVGKTGAKEALALALSRQGPTHASAGNLNNHIGLPLSLARMPAAARFGVFELGMNHAGEIAPLSALLRPHVAIITTVEAVHIEYFPDVAAIADAKAEIFTGMDADGVAVLNRDNPYYDRLAGHARAHGIRRIWGFGEAAAAEARPTKVLLEPEGSTVKAAILGRNIEFRLAMPGRHHVWNALAVLLAVAALDGDVEAAASALADVAPVAGRGVAADIPVPGGSFRLIDESYNASPAAVRAALHVLGMSRPGPGGRRVAVLGDMLELGSDSAALHAGLAAPLIEAGVALVFTTGPLMRGLQDALPPDRRGEHADDAAALAGLVAASVKAGDIVLVKGSAGSKMGTIVAALRKAGPDIAGARHAV
jgi:UDP-N-acetylmuramoyl-tripeptide--D-alanyl-D-alanine ligase